MTREAIFSERRALRVRVVRPGANRGIPFPPDGFTMSRWPRGPMPRSSRCLPLRACGARPSAKGQSRAGMPFRGNPEMARKTVFSEGRTPCVRMVKPHECRGIPFQPDAWANGRRPSGSCRGETNGVIAGVRSPPLPFPHFFASASFTLSASSLMLKGF